MLDIKFLVATSNKLNHTRSYCDEPTHVGFPHKKMKFFKTFQNSGRMKIFLDLH